MNCVAMAAESEDRNIFIAITHGNLHRLRSLLSSIDDLNVRDHNFRTPLIHAVAVSSDEALITHVVRQLVQRGCDINAQDALGRTALMYACLERDKLDVVKLLAKCRRCDPNLQDVDGNTALIHSVESGNTPALRILTHHPHMKSAPKMDLKNSAGLTALQLAAKLGLAECCRVLMRNGGDSSKIKSGELWPQLAENHTKNHFEKLELSQDCDSDLDESLSSLPSSRDYIPSSFGHRPQSKLTFRTSSQVFDDSFRPVVEEVVAAVRKTNRSVLGMRRDLEVHREISNLSTVQSRNHRLDILEKTTQPNHVPPARSSPKRTVVASTEDRKKESKKDRKTMTRRPLTPISNWMQSESTSLAGDLPLPSRLPSIPSGKKLRPKPRAPTDMT